MYVGDFMRRVGWSIAIGVLFIGVSLWLWQSYEQAVPRTNKATTNVSNELLAEIGEFSKPEFRPAVQAYLSNLEIYQQLAMTPLPATGDLSQVEAALRPILNDHLRNDPNSAKVLARQPKEIVKSLSDHYALLIARCSGMGSDEYLSKIGTEAVLKLPSNREMLLYMVQTFLPGRPIPTENVDTTALRSLFTDLYKVEQQYHSGSERVVSICLESRGLLAGIREISGDTRYKDLLFDYLSEDRRKLLFGSLSQPSLVFASPPDDVLALAKKTDVLRAELIIVVKTQNNDFYPIIYQSIYDTKRSRWWPFYINRQSSPRMAAAPPLVF